MTALGDAAIWSSRVPEQKVAELFEHRLFEQDRRLDRLFIAVLLVQWAFAILIAALVSPRTWAGTVASPTVHLMTAVVLGGVLTLGPAVMAAIRPGWLGTRLSIAVAQALWSTLLIHLTGGRIETHFHIFGSLAFLAFYRDWRLLLVATLLVDGDHLIRGALWPESIYGTGHADLLRFAEHSGWVAFEDVVLLFSMRESRRDLWALCQRQVQVIFIKNDVEKAVGRRTKELVETHGFLQRAIDISADSIILTDPNARVLLYNAAVSRRCGDSCREGARLSEIWPDGAAGQTIDQLIREAVMQEARVDSELVTRDTDGTTRNLYVVASPSAGLHGEHAVLTMAVDVTELRRTEQRLSEYGRLFEVGKTLAFVLDEDGTIRQASHGWTELFGYSPSELAGRKLTTLLHPDDVGRFAGSGLSRLDGAECGVRAFDGSHRRVAWSAACEEGGRVTYAAGHDVTELRRAQLAAEQARARAEAESQVKSRFLANMSHEVRTPMNGVIGMTRLVLDTELTAEQREYLNAAYMSAEGLLAIINDILDISKIEAGKMRLEVASFALRTVIDAALGPLLITAKEKGLTTHVAVDDRVPERVDGDCSRLRQVLLNLVGNAVKFTLKGSVSISVSVAETNSDVVEFAVTDTGVGIAADKHDRVFENFRQADESTTRIFGGTGLGLALSRELAALMGGRIWFESEIGRGSTFHFSARLPKTASPQAEAAPVSPARAQVSSAEPRLTVLLAEDNAVNAMLGRKLIGAENCEVVHVANGLEAVRASASRAFDLVLMDLQMPEMDGIEATIRIRARDASVRRVPIVALTANAMAGDAERCIEAGMDGHLSKPIDRARLRALLEQIRETVRQGSPQKSPIRATGSA